MTAFHRLQLTHSQALAFGYFEALLRIGDPDKIRTEMVKLTSFNKTLVNLGYDTMLFEDFVDATLELLERTAASLPNHDGEAIILQTFNEDETSSQIVYHFRVGTRHRSCGCNAWVAKG